MEPSGNSQPPPDAAYKVEGNPVSKTPAEQHETQYHLSETPTEKRKSTGGQPLAPLEHAVPSSLGWGSRDDGSQVEERFGITAVKAGHRRELDGDKMRGFNEGEVADTVSRKPGASGTQPDLAGDLDRKKREQASVREAVKEQKEHSQLPEFGDRRGTQKEGLEEV